LRTFSLNSAKAVRYGITSWNCLVQTFCRLLLFCLSGLDFFFDFFLRGEDGLFPIIGKRKPYTVIYFYCTKHLQNKMNHY
jgi:hypothetical protein